MKWSKFINAVYVLRYEVESPARVNFLILYKMKMFTVKFYRSVLFSITPESQFTGDDMFSISISESDHKRHQEEFIRMFSRMSNFTVSRVARRLFSRYTSNLEFRNCIQSIVTALTTGE